MRILPSGLLLLFLIGPRALVQATDLPLAKPPDLRAAFESPAPQRRARPLWFWNGPLTADKTRLILEACQSSGYSGVGILPAQGMKPEFMTPEFLDQYQVAVEHAAQLGLKLCLYDEFWFPSGSAGGLLARRHPEALSKRLDMLARDVTGPSDVVQEVPPGTFMGAVAMNTASKQRVDVSSQARGGSLRWTAPSGQWKLMIFTCVRDGGDGLVDYLSPEAVSKFIELTYQAYFDKFPTHFGKTIDSAFYDEPAFYHVQGGRAWTERFNELFQARYKTNPILLYPALWDDIGSDTAAARNALFGFRAELYATGFVRTINDWCRAHGIQLTGHVDQEEISNPVIGLCGDLMRAFKYQDIPGIDQIFQYGRASRAYKVVSSAAFNFDRPLVMTECYGAMDNMPVPTLYKEAMDQFAKGINCMVPHAVWYEPAKIIFKPDLSPSAGTYGPELRAFNQYIGRLQELLQAGRHIADIAVLYPIATLQAGSWFGPGKPYEGCVAIPEADYMAIGEMLALSVRRDFTFLHPDMLEERCSVAGPVLRLNNAVNAEHFRVFILPGSRCVGFRTLQRIKSFYDQGGVVIGTTQLPTQSDELGQDGAVRQIVAHIFGEQTAGMVTDPHQNSAGGRAWFLGKPTAEALKTVLDQALPDGDVVVEQSPTLTNGNFSYIHKAISGQSVFFFANSSDQAVDTWVRLRGHLEPELWNPYDGSTRATEAQYISGAGGPVTRVHLVLPPVRSAFVVAPQD
jgi:hypothetical protein